MKGVVFNLLEDAVTRAFGPDAWDDLIDEAGVEGAYTSLGNYSDEEVSALVAAAARKLGKSPAEVLQWFGRAAMPLLKERYGGLFEGHATSRDFVLGVNEIIHPEVRKLYAGAACPFFHMKVSPDGGLTMRYQSTRELFDLAHGFVLGAADLWGETANVVRGPEPDRMTVTWA